MTVLLLIVASLFAEAVGTVAGFGSSTLLLPLALLGFDFPNALALVGLYHLTGVTFRFYLFRRGIDRQLLLRFGIPAVTFTLLGALLVPVIPQLALKGILGLFLVTYSGFSLLSSEIKLKRTFFNTLLGGTLTGFFSGLIGTGGALRTAFLTAFRLPKVKHLATSALIALLVDLTRVPTYLINGFLSPRNYGLALALIATSAVGTLLGEKIVRFIPQKQFRFVLYLAVLLAGSLFVREWITK